MILLATIKISEKETRLYRDARSDFPLMRLELKKLRHAKRYIKKLAACGVSRVALSDQLKNKLEPILLRYSITTLDGRDILTGLSPKIALIALKNCEIPIFETGVEISAGGAHSFNAIEVCSRKVRYISVYGRGSESLIKRASDILGFSVISGTLPPGLCRNIIRLYFDGRPELFTIITPDGSRKFKSADILFPEKYSDLCESEYALGFAKALVQSGKLTISQLDIGRVELTNC